MQGDSVTFRNGADLRIGFLGGGQLGRMTIQAALDLDYRIHILDPDPQCPCARIAHQFTQGDLNDAEAVIAWGRTLDVATVEIENVSIEGLTALKAMGVQVLPDPSHLALIRDKGTQKEFYASHGIPTSDFALVEDGRSEGHEDKDMLAMGDGRRKDQLRRMLNLLHASKLLASEKVRHRLVTLATFQLERSPLKSLAP